MNIMSRLARETGLTRLVLSAQPFHCTHYPSTPLPNASLLSSAVANPVRAKILALAWTILGGGTMSGKLTDFVGDGRAGESVSEWRRRVASTFRIARVASWPFMTGIEMSMRMMLRG